MLNGSRKEDEDKGMRPRRVNGRRGANGSTAATSEAGTKRVRDPRKGEVGGRTDENEDEDEEDEGDWDTVAFDSEDDASGMEKTRILVRVSPGRNHAERHPRPDLPATGGRTLRPRKSMTAAQLYEEEEEKAYRRAVAR